MNVSSFKINDFFNELSKNCSKTQIKQFNKGEIITSFITKREQLCFLISGEADLIRYDLQGNRAIIEHYSANDIFGEIFYSITTNNELFVEAQKKSTVLFYDYNNISNPCSNNCIYHNKIFETLPTLFLNKLNSLNTRLEILTKRTIREKILTYFNIISNTTMNKSFSLPFTLTDLADYLNVDRSAMMRELSYLKNDKIIEKNGNKITLLYK